MSLQLFSPDSRTTINWASGTSTEVFYPPDGSFADRNFLFRISTATVQAEESAFTFFEGINRHLMILKGELELIYEGRYTKQLKKYDQDTFSGEWSTRSKGKVTDFNLMLKQEATGSLAHHRLEAGSAGVFRAEAAFYFLYLASGVATLSNGNTTKEGDLIWIENGTDVTIEAIEPCDVIEIKVVLQWE